MNVSKLCTTITISHNLTLTTYFQYQWAFMMLICGGLGEGQYGQHVAASLTFLMSSFLVSVVQADASASPSCSRLLPYSWTVISHCSCEGKWSQERPMPPSCWRPSLSTDPATLQSKNVLFPYFFWSLISNFNDCPFPSQRMRENAVSFFNTSLRLIHLINKIKHYAVCTQSMTTQFFNCLNNMT